MGVAMGVAYNPNIYRDELGKRLVSQEEYYQKLLETHVKRAIDSEVRLLNERKETLIKPTEQRLQELDRLW